VIFPEQDDCRTRQSVSVGVLGSRRLSISIGKMPSGQTDLLDLIRAHGTLPVRGKGQARPNVRTRKASHFLA
jgi:hypothetical protein